MTTDAGELMALEWSRLLEKDDRTSPEEYPEMCLITREEVGEIIERALSLLSVQVDGEQKDTLAPGPSELEDAHNACLDLAAKHGFATGHGDTVGDMIREFSMQVARAVGDVVERCAKIAEPWPGFILGDNSTEADRAVVAVRTEIAKKIRSLAVLVNEEQKKPPIRCDNCGKMYSDHAPEGDVVCECAAQAVRAMKEAMMGRSQPIRPEAYMAVTGTAGVGEGCDRPFWLEQDAIEYVRRHGGHVRPLFCGPRNIGSAQKSRSVIPDQNVGMNAANDPSVPPPPVAETDADAPGDAGAGDDIAEQNYRDGLGPDIVKGCLEEIAQLSKTPSSSPQSVNASGVSSDPTLSAEGIREALEQLVSACEQVFCSDATEKPTAELEPCSDDDAVMAGEDGDDRRLTFGMIRRARAALSALPVQSGQTNPHGAVDE